MKDELGVVERMRPGWRKLCFWNDSYLVGVGRGGGGWSIRIFTTELAQVTVHDMY